MLEACGPSGSFGELRRAGGSQVAVSVMGPGVAVEWTLTSDGASWRFGAPSDRPLIAQLEVTTEQAWRLLSSTGIAIVTCADRVG